MSLRIRRGSNANRLASTFDMGEIVFTTDTKKLYIGDGVTLGGNNVLATAAGPGLEWNSTTQQFQIGTYNLTTDSITEGTSETAKLFFTAQRAQDAAATLVTHTNHVGISFSYDAQGHQLIGTVDSFADLSTTDVSEGTNKYYTAERAQDDVVALINAGIHSNISFSYSDSLNALSVTALTNEIEVQSVVAGMINDIDVQLGVFISYNAVTHKIELEVDNNNIKDRAAALLVNGVNSGITYAYDAETYELSSTVDLSSVTSLVADNIIGNGITVEYDNVDDVITLTNDVTDSTIDARITAYLPAASGAGFLRTDGTDLSWGNMSVASDTSPVLGGNLTLNDFNITGNGSINVVGISTFSQMNQLAAGIPYRYNRARGTALSPTTIEANDVLTELRFSGHNGTTYVQGASIVAKATGTISSTEMGTSLIFNTSDGTSGLKPIAEISHLGVLSVDSIAPLTDTETAFTALSGQTVAASSFITTGVYANATARNNAITAPVPGTIVLVGTVFQGYNGASWVNLSA